MYLEAIKVARIVNPAVRVIGLTATPYRLTSGMICGPDNVLNHICYEVGVRELIDGGYLSPLKSKQGAALNTSGLHTRGGEFVAGEVEALMDDDARVRAAVAEIVRVAADRKAVLVFASGVEHGEHLAEHLRAESGCEVETIFGDTDSDQRAATIARFKSGALKYLVNMNVLTTGFDAPNVDCVALVRPTASPGLYYQMVGRGFRKSPGKDHCVVLDFGGNILRHGPIDRIEVKTKPKGDGVPPQRVCPQCQEIVAVATRVCACGCEFPLPERQGHDTEASDAAILSGEPEWLLAVHAAYFHHRGRDGKLDTLEVEYCANGRFGFGVREWLCFDHTGYARQKAERWWRERCDGPVPVSVPEALERARAGELRCPKNVQWVREGKFMRVIGYQWEDGTETRGDTLPGAFTKKTLAQAVAERKAPLPPSAYPPVGVQPSYFTDFLAKAGMSEADLPF
jgi:DNA repair protein RadD